MLFKCKVCGGDLDLKEKNSVGTCLYCGTSQTLPRLDDEKRINLYERANHFRRQGDFDKASGIYETILNEDRTDAEAYWSLVLCKYGVEYVEDPATKKRVPTCNRTQYTSIIADEDYKQALAHADGLQKTLYEEEARIIEGIQKGILEISSKEDPYDIFICYKESDENNRRTPDSVLANDMYHQLTNEGFKVFFAKITLEDKLGSAYEPSIFAALQSSKIMVALGTKPEYFNAVWVKNEWSRYLGLIKGGAKKTLIPAYKDMDPYGLPEEFAHLQAQDMGKLGFMQDLIRGIKKILGPAPSQAVPSPAPSQTGPVGSTLTLLQRAFLELEDGNWDKADSLLEKVLNADPQNCRAYVGKLLASQKIRTEPSLATAQNRLSDNSLFQKALRFADPDYRKVLEGYGVSVDGLLELKRKQSVYNQAVEASKNLETVSRNSSAMTTASNECKKVANLFRSISGFKDAENLANEMDARAAHVVKMASDQLKKEKRSKLIKGSIKWFFILLILLGLAYFTLPYFAPNVIPSVTKFLGLDKKAGSKEKTKDEGNQEQGSEGDFPFERTKISKILKQKYTLCRLTTASIKDSPDALKRIPKGQKPDNNVDYMTITYDVIYKGEEKSRNFEYQFYFGPKDDVKSLMEKAWYCIDPENDSKVYKILKNDPRYLPDVLLEYTADGKIVNHGTH